jgi:uncharacterized protein
MLTATWDILLELAPWLLLGMVFAGLLHVLLPPDLIQRQLRGRAGVLKAVALGVPLPLCSCGVIPAGIGLKRDGASNGSSVGFLISTPQTGVDSILVSASFLGWPFALFKVAAAFVTGIAGGWLTDAVATDDDVQQQTLSTTDGSRRGLRDGLAHAMEILGGIWRWLVIGIVASAAISTWVPSGSLATFTPLGTVGLFAAVLLISVPLYVCATASVPIAAALVASGMPTGAALVFLMAGPATNVATIGAIYRGLGKRTLAVYLATIIGGSVAFGLAFDFLLDAAPTAVHAHHEHATWWALASAIVLLALMGYHAATELRLWVGKLRARSMTEVPRHEVPVSGLGCNSCVNKLTAVLSAQEGVQAVEVTLEPGRAVVLGEIEVERIRELIEEAGYEAG